MNNIFFYQAATVLYGAGAALYIVSCIFSRTRVVRYATATAAVALLIHAWAFFLRWYESYELGMGHIPVRGPFECMTFSAGTILALYLAVEYKIKSRALGAAVLPAVFLLMISAVFNPSIDAAIEPMPEVLQGNYISYHLASCFAGYAAFSVSCMASIMIFLYKKPAADEKAGHAFVSREALDDINYKMIAVGFIMFSIMLVTGMFRSKIIWGSYWEWDPVQTWSLLVLILYAVIIHGRFAWKWSAETVAALSILAFAAAVVSFLVGAGLVSGSGHYPITG